MNEDFKKIAKGLGVVLPACLLSIGTANAAVPMPTTNSDVPSVCVKLNKGNDVISHLIANTGKYSSDEVTPDHTNRHANRGGNHTDRYTDESHTDYHSNTNAYNNSDTGQCIPHSNTHTNYGQNRHKHTNSGDPHHTDTHSDYTVNTQCP
jgi:hypothetical protein